MQVSEFSVNNVSRFCSKKSNPKFLISKFFKTQKLSKDVSKKKMQPIVVEKNYF